MGDDERINLAEACAALVGEGFPMLQDDIKIVFCLSTKEVITNERNLKCDIEVNQGDSTFIGGQTFYCNYLYESEITDSRPDSSNHELGKKKKLICYIFSSKKTLSREIIFQKIFDKFLDKFNDILLLHLLNKDAENLDKEEYKKYWFGHWHTNKEVFKIEYYTEILQQINAALDNELIGQLSVQTYENRPLKTKIAFIDEKTIKNLSGIVVFDPDSSVRFNVESLREIRKILEIGQQSGIILLKKDDLKIYGFVADVPDGLFVNYQNIFYLSFEGLGQWKMSQDKEDLLFYKDGIYTIPEEKTKAEDRECDKLKLLYEKCEAIDDMKKLINGVSKQSHGTSIVVFLDQTQLSTELERLNNAHRLRKIDIRILNEVELLGVSAIDGALFVDSKGLCYAIGVILDGVAQSGDRGRGARYNSMQTYIKSVNCDKMNAIGVVLSEDRTIDVITGE